jgi:hypothetical protein
MLVATQTTPRTKLPFDPELLMASEPDLLALFGARALALCGIGAVTVTPSHHHPMVSTQTLLGAAPSIERRNLWGIRVLRSLPTPKPLGPRGTTSDAEVPSYVP